MVAYLTSSADFIWVLGQPYYFRNNLCVLCYLDLAWQVSQVGQSLTLLLQSKEKIKKSGRYVTHAI